MSEDEDRCFDANSCKPNCCGAKYVTPAFLLAGILPLGCFLAIMVNRNSNGVLEVCDKPLFAWTAVLVFACLPLMCISQWAFYVRKQISEVASRLILALLVFTTVAGLAVSSASLSQTGCLDYEPFPCVSNSTYSDCTEGGLLFPSRADQYWLSVGHLVVSIQALLTASWFISYQILWISVGMLVAFLVGMPLVFFWYLINRDCGSHSFMEDPSPEPVAVPPAADELTPRYRTAPLLLLLLAVVIGAAVGSVPQYCQNSRTDFSSLVIAGMIVLGVLCALLFLVNTLRHPGYVRVFPYLQHTNFALHLASICFGITLMVKATSVREHCHDSYLSLLAVGVPLFTVPFWSVLFPLVWWSIYCIPFGIPLLLGWLRTGECNETLAGGLVIWWDFGDVTPAPAAQPAIVVQANNNNNKQLAASPDLLITTLPLPEQMIISNGPTIHLDNDRPANGHSQSQSDFPTVTIVRIPSADPGAPGGAGGKLQTIVSVEGLPNNNANSSVHPAGQSSANTTQSQAETTTAVLSTEQLTLVKFCGKCGTNRFSPSDAFCRACGQRHDLV